MCVFELLQCIHLFEKGLVFSGSIRIVDIKLQIAEIIVYLTATADRFHCVSKDADIFTVEASLPVDEYLRSYCPEIVS